MIEIDIQTTPLDPQVCLQKVEDPTVGGIVSFVGSVRNHSQGKKVLKLEFECYEKMARSEMKKIAQRAVENFHVENILIHHRVGTLEIGDIAVVIVTASAHRKNAFEACQFAIDELKKTVPIWKKEFFENGSHWVSAHP